MRYIFMTRDGLNNDVYFNNLLAFFGFKEVDKIHSVEIGAMTAEATREDNTQEIKDLRR